MAEGCSHHLPFLLPACAMGQRISGPWMEICRFHKDDLRSWGQHLLVFLASIHPSILLLLPPGAQGLVPPERPHRAQPEHPCLLELYGEREGDLSPAGNLPINTPDTKVSMELFPQNQLRCLSPMGSLKISIFSTNSLKMLKTKSNKGWRMDESLNYRAIFRRAKQNTQSPSPGC